MGSETNPGLLGLFQRLNKLATKHKSFLQPTSSDKFELESYFGTFDDREEETQGRRSHNFDLFAEWCAIVDKVETIVAGISDQLLVAHQKNGELLLEHHTLLDSYNALENQMVELANKYALAEQTLIQAIPHFSPLGSINYTENQSSEINRFRNSFENRIFTTLDCFHNKGILDSNDAENYRSDVTLAAKQNSSSNHFLKNPQSRATSSNRNIESNSSQGFQTANIRYQSEFQYRTGGHPSASAKDSNVILECITGENKNSSVNVSQSKNNSRLEVVSGLNLRVESVKKSTAPRGMDELHDSKYESCCLVDGDGARDASRETEKIFFNSCQQQAQTSAKKEEVDESTSKFCVSRYVSPYEPSGRADRVHGDRESEASEDYHLKVGPDASMTDNEDLRGADSKVSQELFSLKYTLDDEPSKEPRVDWSKLDCFIKNLQATIDGLKHQNERLTIELEQALADKSSLTIEREDLLLALRRQAEKYNIQTQTGQSLDRGKSRHRAKTPRTDEAGTSFEHSWTAARQSAQPLSERRAKKPDRDPQGHPSPQKYPGLNLRLNLQSLTRNALEPDDKPEGSLSSKSSRRAKDRYQKNAAKARGASLDSESASSSVEPNRYSKKSSRANLAAKQAGSGRLDSSYLVKSAVEYGVPSSQPRAKPAPPRAECHCRKNLGDIVALVCRGCSSAACGLEAQLRGLLNPDSAQGPEEPDRDGLKLSVASLRKAALLQGGRAPRSDRAGPHDSESERHSKLFNTTDSSRRLDPGRFKGSIAHMYLHGAAFTKIREDADEDSSLEQTRGPDQATSPDPPETDLRSLASQVEEAKRKSARLFKKCNRTRKDLQRETLRYLQACDPEEKELVEQTFRVVADSMKNEVEACSGSLDQKDRAAREQAGQVLRDLLAHWSEAPERTSRIQAALLSKWRKVLQVIDGKKRAQSGQSALGRPN